MTRLGGHAIFLEPDKMQISHGDTPKEIGKILSSYGHGIAIRHCDWGDGNKYLREVAEHARVPVINMQCDVYHPCQAMADLMTCHREKGRPARQKSGHVLGLRQILHQAALTCRSRSSNSSHNLERMSHWRTHQNLN